MRIECIPVRSGDLETGSGLCGLRMQRFRWETRRPLAITAPTPHNQEFYIIGLSCRWRFDPAATAMGWLPVIALGIWLSGSFPISRPAGNNTLPTKRTCDDALERYAVAYARDADAVVVRSQLVLRLVEPLTLALRT